MRDGRPFVGIPGASRLFGGRWRRGSPRLRFGGYDACSSRANASAAPSRLFWTIAPAATVWILSNTRNDRAIPSCRTAKRQMRLRRRGTDGLPTHRWRGESAANPSLNRRSDEFLESIKKGSKRQSAAEFFVIKIILHNFDVFTREKRRIPEKWLAGVNMLLLQHVNLTF